MNLQNYVSGEWKQGAGPGEPLIDPVTGEELARISSKDIDVAAALNHARTKGVPSLQALTYAQRAELLAKLGDLLTANRDEYFRISLLNSGANATDASFDVDGALYTMKFFAKIGKPLGEGKILKEGAVLPLSKTNVFSAQHFLEPAKGTAIFINAFNFPAWGLCEKAAPALLAGVPIVVKPASPTAWLTHKMAEDIIKSGILPEGAISILAGSARDLLDHVREGDTVSFTGSADTAARIRSNSKRPTPLSPRKHRSRQHQFSHPRPRRNAGNGPLRSIRKRSSPRNDPKSRTKMHSHPPRPGPARPNEIIRRSNRRASSRYKGRQSKERRSKNGPGSK